MSDARPPSRVVLIIAGLLTQLVGAACLVATLAALPMVHDLHSGMKGIVASAIAAIAAIVCGTLVHRGRLIPLALAVGVEIGFGIVLPHGNSPIGAILRILPADDVDTANALVTAGAIAMFVAAIACALAIPNALALRRWARAALDDDAGASRELSDSAADAAPTNELIRPSDTLKGLGGARQTPTMLVHVQAAPSSRSRPLIVAGVAVTVIAIGMVVITSMSADQPATGEGAGFGSTTVATVGSARGSSAHAGSGPGSEPPATAGSAAPAGSAEPPPTVASDASSPDAPQEQSPQDFVDAFHAGLASGDDAALGALLDAKVFAFGVESNELAEGRTAVVAFLRRDVGMPPKQGVLTIEAAHLSTGHDGDVAWIAEDVTIGTRRLLVTAVLGRHDTSWTIAALHWALPMPNETAYRLGRDGTLGVPDAIPDNHDTSPLATAMRAAFASKPSFVEARSMRADAFNFGSALGERIAGGDAIRRTFSRIKATIRLHDAVKVGTIGDRGGWGAANVDFTDEDADGTEVTQTFRVLAAWVKEDAGWRIVQTQWSNPR